MYIKSFSLFIIALILSACSINTGPRVSIEDAWVKQAKVSEITPGDLNKSCICERVTATNAYMRIYNKGFAADRLTKVEADAAVKVELRQTDADETLSYPLLSDGVDIPVFGKADFAAGSYAMVLKDLRGDLKPGDTVNLSLFFEKTGKMDIAAEVR